MLSEVLGVGDYLAEVQDQDFIGQPDLVLVLFQEFCDTNQRDQNVDAFPVEVDQVVKRIL